MTRPVVRRSSAATERLRILGTDALLLVMTAIPLALLPVILPTQPPGPCCPPPPPADWQERLRLTKLLAQLEAERNELERRIEEERNKPPLPPPPPDPTTVLRQQIEFEKKQLTELQNKAKDLLRQIEEKRKATPDETIARGPRGELCSPVAATTNKEWKAFYLTGQLVFPVDPEHFEADQARTTQGNDALVLTPRYARGKPITDLHQKNSELAKRVSNINPKKSALLLLVTRDAVDTFFEFWRYAATRKLDLGWEPITDPQGRLIMSDGGREPGCQTCK